MKAVLFGSFERCGPPISSEGNAVPLYDKVAGIVQRGERIISVPMKQTDNENTGGNELVVWEPFVIRDEGPKSMEL